MESKKLNRGQVLKELQKHKKYRNKTQKEISDKLGGVNDLRIELIRLDGKSKSIKSSRKNQQKTTHIETESTTPDDIIYNLMLNSDFKTLLNLCQTNKIANHYCKDKHFWGDKLKHEKLPPIRHLDMDTNWIASYQLLLRAADEAKLMMLVTAEAGL